MESLIVLRKMESWQNIAAVRFSVGIRPSTWIGARRRFHTDPERGRYGVSEYMTTVYVGNVSSSLVRVGELFRDAVRLNASAVILVHNHPSGDPTPSPDDLHLTAEALAAGRLLDIDLLDHLVIGHDAFVSLRDRGVAFDRPRAS
jgi:hypothetical protein